MSPVIGRSRTQIRIVALPLDQFFHQQLRDSRLGILAKASELKSIYSSYLSSAFKIKIATRAGHVSASMLAVAKDNAYPLHAGWLMAVASYNAGHARSTP